MIIVEGSDGAGKTRLVLRLIDDLGVRPEPRRVSKDMEALVPLKQIVEDDMKTWPRKALYDRHRLISEPIYSIIFRDKPHDGFEDRAWVSDMLYQFTRANPIIIYCLPPLKEVIANVNRGDDNKIVKNEIVSIYWAYHFQACQTPNAFVWDYTRPSNNYGILLSHIKRHGKARFNLEY